MTESNKKTDAKDKIDCMETEEVPVVGSEEDSAVILRWMGWRNKVAAIHIISLQVFLYWYVAIKSGCCWEDYWATHGCMHIQPGFRGGTPLGCTLPGLLQAGVL